MLAAATRKGAWFATCCLLIAGCGRSPTGSARTEPSFDEQVKAALRGETFEIVVTQAPVGDAELARLAGLITLEKIVLDQADVTDAGLQSLANLKSLEQLRIRGGTIGDAGIEALLGLESLRVLNLPQAEITDAGLCAWPPSRDWSCCGWAARGSPTKGWPASGASSGCGHCT